MTHVYGALTGGGETRAVFSTLEKAKHALEADIIKKIREGRYGKELVQGELPQLTWQQYESGTHVCGFVRERFGVPAQWYSADELYLIAFDPDEIPE